MAMRRAVVGTHVGGVDEAIIDGRTGLLVPPDDPCAMARALNRLIDSASLRRALGHRARERIMHLFSLEAVGRRLADVITSVVETSQRPTGYTD
jgi:glycosyltransferase involved in cell wall biosynthesis